MKYYILFSITLANLCMANAQQVTPTEISYAGAFFTSSSFSIVYTVGENTITTDSIAGIGIVTQGFNQPPLRQISAIQNVQWNINVFPNPTSDLIFIDSDLPFESELYSLNGDLVLGKTKSNVLKTNQLASGIYILKLTVKDQINKQIKISVL